MKKKQYFDKFALHLTNFLKIKQNPNKWSKKKINMDENYIYFWTINILKLVNMKNTFHIINDIKVFFVLPFLRSKTNLVQLVDYFCCEIWTWLYLYVIYFNLSVVDLESTGITFSSNDSFVWFQKWDFLLVWRILIFQFLSICWSRVSVIYWDFLNWEIDYSKDVL